MNLLKETLEELKDNNKKQSDVLWVEVRGEMFSWRRFKNEADMANIPAKTANLPDWKMQYRNCRSVSMVKKRAASLVLIVATVQQCTIQ